MINPLLLLSPAALVAGGLVYEGLGRRGDRSRFPPTGQMVRVGSTRLHVRVLGKGSPAIVLEAGAGQWSTHWGSLVGRLAELSTVVAYDRAGLGWSDAGEGPRTARTAASELRELLRQVAPDAVPSRHLPAEDIRTDAGGFLLVGHAEGARVLRAFAHRYPQDTAGLVFVDGYHEALEGELAQAGIPSPRLSPRTLRAFILAARLGILRLLGHAPLAAGLEQSGLGRGELDAIGALGRTARVLRGILAEERAATDSDRALSLHPTRPSPPLRVLIAGQTLPAQGVPPEFPRDEFNRIWARVSALLARGGGPEGDGGSAEAEILEDSDHLLPLRFPQRVIECVDDVLNRARGSSPG